jgi:hypothetical protein
MLRGWPNNGIKNNTRKGRRQRHVPTQPIMSRMLELPVSCCAEESLGEVEDLCSVASLREITM